MNNFVESRFGVWMNLGVKVKRWRGRSWISAEKVGEGAALVEDLVDLGVEVVEVEEEEEEEVESSLEEEVESFFKPRKFRLDFAGISFCC
jgi:hypothetical protein